MVKRHHKPPINVLRTARRLARLTQAQLAAKAGVDETLISHFEIGRRDWRNAHYEIVVRLARALNLKPDELFPVDDAVEKVS